MQKTFSQYEISVLHLAWKKTCHTFGWDDKNLSRIFITIFIFLLTVIITIYLFNKTNIVEDNLIWLISTKIAAITIFTPIFFVHWLQSPFKIFSEQEKEINRLTLKKTDWQPAWKVVQHIAKNINEPLDNNFYENSRTQLRQAALENKVKSRGKIKIKRGYFSFDKPHSDVFSDISSEYWKSHTIYITASIENEQLTPSIIKDYEQTEYHTYPEIITGENDNSYFQLQFDWSQVILIWPEN